MTNQEAIEKLVNAEYADKWQGDEELTLALHMAVEALSSAEPKRGRWNRRSDMDYADQNKVTHIHGQCSECGLIHDFIDGHTAQYNYCPQCGAKMDGQDGGAENG